MNLLQSEVVNVRKKLRDEGVEVLDAHCRWFNGHVTLVVRCRPSQKEMAERIIKDKTSICIPYLVEEEFKFSF